MKVLILGGTGAMGIDLVNILAEKGYSLSVTTRSLRISKIENIKYIQGNAHDIEFLQLLLQEHYDAVVDFMSYKTEEFSKRLDLLLSSTKQYCFLSSARVYADSSYPITEKSPRILDISADKAYLNTDEYALTKARQENLLFESGKQNWSIIRPYITYNINRLQLGVFEKELWLYRAINRQTVVIPKDILMHQTTLTCGKDVAKGIAYLIGNEKALGQAFHITTDETIYWSEVLELYQHVFRDVTGDNIKVKLIKSSDIMGKVLGNQYQIKYDRLYNRRFDNSKFKKIADNCNFISPQEGLERCLREFCDDIKFRDISAKSIAWMDKMSGESTSIANFKSQNSKIKYTILRYTPYFTIYSILKKY